MKITKDFIRALQPGEVVMAVCKTAAQLDSIYRLAMDVRSDSEDRTELAVSRGATTLTAVIRRNVLFGEQDSRLTRTVFAD